MNLKQSCYAIVSYKIKCDFGNWSLWVITQFFFSERIITAISNFQGMSAKNDSLLQIEEIVGIYANPKYLDRNVQWVLFILAEYLLDKKHDILAQWWLEADTRTLSRQRLG